MKRREFIGLLGGAAVAWPLAARAQQPDPMRRIGVLMGYAESDLEAQAWVAAFVEGLKRISTLGKEIAPWQGKPSAAWQDRASGMLHLSRCPVVLDLVLKMASVV